MSDTELVVIGTFLNQIEADMAQGALEAADIESMISADDAGGLRPHLWMGGVRLRSYASTFARGARPCW